MLHAGITCITSIIKFFCYLFFIRNSSKLNLIQYVILINHKLCFCNQVESLQSIDVDPQDDPRRTLTWLSVIRRLMVNLEGRPSQRWWSLPKTKNEDFGEFVGSDTTVVGKLLFIYIYGKKLLCMPFVGYHLFQKWYIKKNNLTWVGHFNRG